MARRPDRTVTVALRSDGKGFETTMREAADDLRKLTRETEKSQRELDKMSRAMERAEERGRRMRSGLAALGGAAAAVFSTQAVQQTLDWADALGKTADRLGLTTDALQELGHAAELTGVSQRTLESSLQRLTRRAADAAAGNTTLARSFEAMDVQVVDTAGNLRATEDIFLDMADAMAAMESQSERVLAAQKVLDIEGVALVNTLQGGSDAIRAMADEAQELGLVLRGDLIRQAEAANDALSRVSTQLKVAFASAVLENVDAIEDLAAAFSGLIRDMADSGVVQFVTGSLNAVAEVFRQITLAARDVREIGSRLGFGDSAGHLDEFQLALLDNVAVLEEQRDELLENREALDNLTERFRAGTLSVIDYEEMLELGVASAEELGLVLEENERALRDNDAALAAADKTLAEYARSAGGAGEGTEDLGGSVTEANERLTAFVANLQRAGTAATQMATTTAGAAQQMNASGMFGSPQQQANFGRAVDAEMDRIADVERANRDALLAMADHWATFFHTIDSGWANIAATIAASVNVLAQQMAQLAQAGLLSTQGISSLLGVGATGVGIGQAVGGTTGSAIGGGVGAIGGALIGNAIAQSFGAALPAFLVASIPVIGPIVGAVAGSFIGGLFSGKPKDPRLVVQPGSTQTPFGPAADFYINRGETPPELDAMERWLIDFEDVLASYLDPAEIARAADLAQTTFQGFAGQRPEQIVGRRFGAVVTGADEELGAAFAAITEGADLTIEQLAALTVTMLELDQAFESGQTLFSDVATAGETVNFVMEEIARANESLAEALARTEASMALVSSLMDTELTAAFGKFSTEVVDQLGGLEAAAQQLGVVFDTFFTPEEIIGQKLEAANVLLDEQFGEIIDTLGVTAGNYREVLELQIASGDLTEDQLADLIAIGAQYGVIIDLEQQLADIREAEAQAALEFVESVGAARAAVVALVEARNALIQTLVDMDTATALFTRGTQSPLATLTEDFLDLQRGFDNWDGSIAQLRDLNAGMEQFQRTAAALAISIQRTIDTIRATAEQDVFRIDRDLARIGGGTEGEYNFLRDAIDALSDEIAATTDPGEIARLQARQAQLARDAWALLTDDQKQLLGEEFKKFFVDSADETVFWLADIRDAVLDTADGLADWAEQQTIYLSQLVGFPELVDLLSTFPQDVAEALGEVFVFHFGAGRLVAFGEFPSNIGGPPTSNPNWDFGGILVPFGGLPPQLFPGQLGGGLGVPVGTIPNNPADGIFAGAVVSFGGWVLRLEGIARTMESTANKPLTVKVAAQPVEATG